jgi:radical SAM superfamily enzyme YgiQ (UPF0313 family)
MCSSFADKYLFPPHDLLSLAGVARAQGHEVFFSDAVAEGLLSEQVLQKIRDIKPQLIVSIMSFELFDKDVDEVRVIKNVYPDVYIVLMGHYPTHFPKETLELTGADMVLLGEPDHIFHNLLDAWKNGSPPIDISGTVIRQNAQSLIINGEDRRVPNPNLLPMPAYDLIIPSLYSEPFMRQPTGIIQSARGCPYKCNYCVHSFGTKLTVLTPENVLEHILFLKHNLGVKSLRFIDDTFTAIPSRVIKLCKLMIEAQVNLPWTCLSRADTLHEEMLHWMKKAGCIRLNIGFESGSQKILDILDKGLILNDCLAGIEAARKIGLEILGFFLTGVPHETDEDLRCSIDFARKYCDFIVVDTLKVYPGTPLFDKFKELVTFSLYPYTNTFNNQIYKNAAEQKRKWFYKSFYYSPRFAFKNAAQILRYPHHLKTAVAYVLKRTE